jgi:hypothetical protein
LGRFHPEGFDMGTTYKRLQVRLALDRLDTAIREGKSPNTVLQLAQDAADAGASLPSVIRLLAWYRPGFVQPA